MPRRSFYLFLPVLALLLVGGLVTPARADELQDANGALDRLAKALKKRKTIPEYLIAGLDEVKEFYDNLTPPAKPEPMPIPDGASDEEKKVIQKANDKQEKAWKNALKKFDRESLKFRRDARKVFIKAFRTVDVNRGTHTNRREDVNARAADILGSMNQDPDLAKSVTKDLMKAMDAGLFNAKDYDPTELLYEKAFAALGNLNHLDSLNWLIDKFTHAKSSPQKEVMKLSAAHKAMLLYKSVPGKVRYALVEKMVTVYAGIESQAEQKSADPKLQEKKRFWDTIKEDVIKVLQYYTGEPLDDEGQVIARMDDFQRWFRKNKNARRAPWVDAKKSK